MESFNTIQSHHLERFKQNCRNPLSRAASLALSKTSLNDICYCNKASVQTPHKFSLELPCLPAQDQKNSGRCWIYSGLNLLREKIAKNLNLETIELSANFVTFWDHLEKANFFLESMIRYSTKSLDNRLVRWHLDNADGDGGLWELFSGLCQKYGLVPLEAMPETFQSQNTGSMNRLINRQLRQDAMLLRKAAGEDKTLPQLREMKSNMLEEIYNILMICLGEPPESFHFEYVDKNGVYHADRNLTPKSFYEKYIGRNLSQMVSLLNAPTDSKPFYRTYQYPGANSVIEAKPVTLLNLPMKDIKAALLRQLQAGEMVYFVCDSEQCENKDDGLWDEESYDFDSPFGLHFSMTKAEMMDYRVSSLDHAMVITGVNLLDGKPTRWKAQNSWGSCGKNGYFTISDAWFDKFVYIVTVDQKYLTEEQRKLLQQEPILLEPWDQIA